MESSLRTDLAIEARKCFWAKCRGDPGVAMETEDFSEIQVTGTDRNGGSRERMGKKQGSYVTLEVPGLRQKH